MTQQLAAGLPFSLLDVVRGQIRDMLSAAVQDSKAWRAVILDETTVKVLSNVMRMSDLMSEHNIAVVENLNKNREPMRDIPGVYFVEPTVATVSRLAFDFGSSAMYSEAHVFFSSAPSPAVLADIRQVPGLVARLKSLKSVSLEYSVVDRCAFSTNQERLMPALYGEAPDQEAIYEQQLRMVSTRLVTLLAALKESPSIRYRAVAPEQGTSAQAAGALVAQRVAVKVHDQLLEMQKTGQMPSGDTCDLLIIDRPFDLMATVLHEWSYEAMATDVLGMQNNVFQYEADTQAGKKEKREHVLNEDDDLWTELRDQHIGAVSLNLSQKMDAFRAKNKVATKAATGAGALDVRSIKALATSLPQYRESLSKLAVHVNIASQLNAAVDAMRLAELSALEQALVFGEAGTKELIAHLTPAAGASSSSQMDKLRLLFIFTCMHPDKARLKVDATRQAQWQKLTKLSPADMEALLNLEALGVPLQPKPKLGLTLTRRRNRAYRKEPEGDGSEQQWAHAQFRPLLHDVIEDLHAGKLSEDEFPSVSQRLPPSSAPAASQAKVSVRSNRSTMGWALKSAQKTATEGAHPPDDHVAGLPKKARRLIVFMVGPVTHSELRVARKLSGKLNRDIVIGGTGVVTPAAFLQSMRELCIGALVEVKGGKQTHVAA